MLVQDGVDGSAPQRDIVKGLEQLHQVVNAVLGGDDATQMELFWYAFGAEGLVGQLEAAARGQHRVGDDEGLVGEIGGGEIFHFDAHVFVFLVEIIAVGRHEGVARMVEDVEEALVEGQTGTKHGGQHDFIVGRVGLGYVQWGLDCFLRVMQRLAYFICHQLPDALQVVTESSSVGLDFNVP